MKIGVVGYGFVGKAVVAGFENPQNELAIADPKMGTTVDDVLEINPELIFVCVPTPMGDDGVANTSIVEQVFFELRNKQYRGISILKSTLVPTIVQKLENLIDRFVYNPEFLTEANAVRDFLNPEFHVFGGQKEDCELVAMAYESNSNCQPAKAVHFVTPTEASLIKYGVNSFLSTKVAFMNQWFDLCQSLGADYSCVSAGMGSDPRITPAHMKVPGNDGRRGFGGACFSKDPSAIIRESLVLDCELSILREAWNSNVKLRDSYGGLLPREIEQHITFNKI